MNFTTGDTEIYLDGELDTTQTATYNSTSYNAESPLGKDRIGTVENASTRFFNGLLDNVALWDRPLSAAEVKQIYLRTANNVLFQVRTCSSACTIEDFVGPDGTPNTFFSETQNAATIDASNEGAGAVLVKSPSLAFSDFTSPLANNRFFQYRVIMESDDPAGTPLLPHVEEVKIGPEHFPDTNPIVENLNPLPYTSLSAFVESSPESCAIKYQLSKDGSNFFYFDGSTWSTASGFSESNTAEGIAANLDLYNLVVGPGSLHMRAFLVSDGQQQCSLDNLQIDGEN